MAKLQISLGNSRERKGTANMYKKMREGHLLKFKNTEREGLPLLYRRVQKKTVHGPGPGSLRSVFDNEDLDDILPDFEGSFEDFFIKNCKQTSK